MLQDLDQYPTKSVLIGNERFNITGISDSDPYFIEIIDNFEPEFMRFCRDFMREDDVCIDIGANLGLKTLLFAQHVPNGRVIAVEPSPSVVQLLERNVRGCGKLNITIVKAAVADIDGTVGFLDDSAWGSISAGGIRVPVWQLSTLLSELDLGRVDLVKIDVEGYEWPILKNSLDILNQYRTLVLLEFNAWCQIESNNSPKEFSEWILSNFAHVFMLRREHNSDEGYLERLPRDGATHLLLLTYIGMVQLLTFLLQITRRGYRSVPPVRCHGRPQHKLFRPKDAWRPRLHGFV